ncbi:MAG: aldehyde dehydrogenase family protein [Dehalococcoidia bacterium]
MAEATSLPPASRQPANRETFQNDIGGRWLEAPNRQTFANENLATGEALALFPNSGPEDVAAAAEAAAGAQRIWRAYPAPRRGEILFRVAGLLRERVEERHVVALRDRAPR